MIFDMNKDSFVRQCHFLHLITPTLKPARLCIFAGGVAKEENSITPFREGVNNGIFDLYFIKAKQSHLFQKIILENQSKLLLVYSK